MRFLVLTSLPVAAVLFAMVGCGGSVALEPADGGAIGEASSSGDSGVQSDTRPLGTDAFEDDVGPVFGECHTLANTAPVVTTRSVSGDSPPAVGGVIVPGIYRLTDAAFISRGAPMPAMSLQLTIRIGAGRFETAHTTEGETDQTSSTYSVSGSTVALTQTCPNTRATTMRYSASGSTLTLFFDLNEDGLNGTFRYTLTRG